MLSRLTTRGSVTLRFFRVRSSAKTTVALRHALSPRPKGAVLEPPTWMAWTAALWPQR